MSLTIIVPPPFHQAPPPTEQRPSGLHVLSRRIMLPAGIVGSSELANDAVLAQHIAAGAVGTSEIADDAVTAAKIAVNAVGSSEIATDAVGSAEIAAGAVSTVKIAAGAITQVASGASSFSHTSATNVAFTSGVSLTPAVGSHLFAGVAGRADTTTAGAAVVIAIRLNGVDVLEPWFVSSSTASTYGSFGGLIYLGVAASATLHTFFLSTRRTAGTATLYAHYVLIEIKR